jgi:hypothetical protein
LRAARTKKDVERQDFAGAYLDDIAAGMSGIPQMGLDGQSALQHPIGILRREAGLKAEEQLAIPLPSQDEAATSLLREE